MTVMKTKVFLCSRLPLHDMQSNSVCPPSAAIPREPCVCLSAVLGSCAGWGAGWPAVQGTQALPLLGTRGGSSWGFFALGEVCSRSA